MPAVKKPPLVCNLLETAPWRFSEEHEAPLYEQHARPGSDGHVRCGRRVLPALVGCVERRVVKAREGDCVVTGAACGGGDGGDERRAVDGEGRSCRRGASERTGGAQGRRKWQAPAG